MILASNFPGYYETYPELINQEYEDYINFVENELWNIFLRCFSFDKKYIERFGGEQLF